GRVGPGWNGAERSRAGNRVFLPAELPEDELAWRKPRIVALDDLADAQRRDHVADLQRRRIRPCLVHPPALVRIDRRPQDVHEHLAGAWCLDLRFVEGEIRVLREA